MLYAPRTIGFLCDLVHAPRALDAGALQALHARTCATRDPAYRNFTVRPDAIALSNPCARPNAASCAEFCLDRIRFREDLTGTTVDEFGARVAAISAEAAPSRGIQAILVQHVTVRTLVNPRHFSDSRDYLKRGMFGFDDETAPLGGEPALYGLRLVVPGTAENPGVHALRVESCAADPRSLYIEEQGTFPSFAGARGFAEARENIERAYRFATERALRFVSRFDARQNA